MYTYNAKVTRIIDGDTLELDIDLGFNVHVNERIRLYGVNTPEIFGAKAKDIIEKTEGLAAKVFVEKWVQDNPELILSSFDSRKIGQEKYGRWLGVLKSKITDESLNDALIEAGHSD